MCVCADAGVFGVSQRSDVCLFMWFMRTQICIITWV